MGAPDLLHHLRGAGLTVTTAAGGGIRVIPAGILTDAQRQAIRDHRAELLVLLASAPPPTTPAPDPLALVAWTDADISRFTARRDRLTRWGWPAADAEAMAERLTQRDRSGDDRVSCTDCRHYRPGRCRNHRACPAQHARDWPRPGDAAAALPRLSLINEGEPMSMFSGGVNAVDRVSTASTSGLTYTVWADFGGRYLWIKEPGDMSRGPGRSWGRPHRVPTALTYELEAWQAKLERATTIYQAEPEGGWDAFDRVGRELAGRLKRELGTDVAVWYVDRAPASHGAGAYEM